MPPKPGTALYEEQRRAEERKSYSGYFEISLDPRERRRLRTISVDPDTGEDRDDDPYTKLDINWYFAEEVKLYGLLGDKGIAPLRGEEDPSGGRGFSSQILVIQCEDPPPET